MSYDQKYQSLSQLVEVIVVEVIDTASKSDIWIGKKFTKEIFWSKLWYKEWLIKMELRDEKANNLN